MNPNEWSTTSIFTRQFDSRGVPVDNLEDLFKFSMSSDSAKEDPPVDPHPEVTAAYTNLINEHYTKFLEKAHIEPNVAKRFLDKVGEVRYDPRQDIFSRFVRAMIKNKRRVEDLHDHLKDQIYLPDMSCKRITYAYLIGILENKYLAIKKSALKDLHMSKVKGSTKVIMLEIEFVALAAGYRTGFDLARPFPREYYARMLYALNPESTVFVRKVETLLEPVGDAPEVNLDELLEDFYQEMPLPQSFRGLIRYDKQRFKVQMIASLFGGEKGVMLQRQRFADFIRAAHEMFRAIKTIQKRGEELNNCILFTDPALQNILNLT